ncbi:restriction endonuclease subunit S [Stutzerimonas xanthomarina]|uniref:restriction endonuclease subunit S n=1 Tax=Stutzerimonas xanthomarina TaxID=271420 RepID=UPI003AA9AB11
MSSEWSATRLRDLVSIKHGFAFKGEFFVDEETPLQLTTPGNFAIGGGFQYGKGKYYAGPVPSDYVLQTGDLIVTMTDLSKAADTLGYAAVVPNGTGTTWLHNQRVGLVRPQEGVKVHMGYIHYLMRSPDYRRWVVSTATGSTVKHTSPDRILSYEFLLPSLAEQREIGETLATLDDRITLLRETNATLEAIAQALFKSWFVDFDPVRAKAEGRQPEGMDATTAALFPDSFEESELGLVPKGWRHVSLKEVTAIFDSKRVPLSGQERDKRKGTYPYYGAAALMDWVDGYLFDGVYLLLGEDGSVADTAGYPVTQYVWGKIWVNNHAHVLQGKAGVSTEHLMLTLQQTNISPYITGAVQAKLSQTNMWRIPFLRSRDEVAIAFGEAIAPLFNSVRHNHEQAQTLTQLRDTLLPRLISGQLRLPEAEALVAEAV